MAYLVGIDVGTSGVKAIACDANGKIVATAAAEYPLHYPRPGWAEQDPQDWWTGTCVALRKLTDKLGKKSKEIKGVALSGQMHSSVFLDKDLQVIRPALLWCDVRTTEQCQWITTQAQGREKLIDYVSNPALEGFTAPKIIWLRQREPENFAKVKYVMMPKDYIRFRLTGEIFTEVSDAAGTLLYDVKNRRWSGELLTKLELNPEILPEVKESIDVCGYVTTETAELTGLPAEIPVAGGSADNACGAVGAGIVREGRALSSIGSSGVLLAHTPQPTTDPKGAVHTFNHSIPQAWYVMGVMLAAGLSYKWFAQAFAQVEQMVETNYGIDLYKLLDQGAAAVEPGCEGLVFLPYLNGERTPHADATARGVFFGLNPRHRKAHFARAILEGVVFALRDSLEIFKDMAIEIKELRAIGGGAKSPLWRQIQADVFNVPVATLNIDEGPAFGASLIAGKAAGVFPSLEEAADELITVKHVTEPNPANVAKYEEIYTLFRGLYPALKDSFQKAARIF